MDTRKVSLKEALAEIPDFRHAQGRRYELLSILLLAYVAMLCGARSESAIAEWGTNYGTKWLRRLAIKGSASPSQPTIHRVFKQLDAVAVERAISRWAASVLGQPVPLEGAAIDGKALRGSIKQGASNAYLLSAVSHRLSTVLAQVAVADRTNEIGQMDDLLAELTLTGLVARRRRDAHTSGDGGNDHRRWRRLPDGRQRESTNAQAGDRAWSLKPRRSPTLSPRRVQRPRMVRASKRERLRSPMRCAA